MKTERLKKILKNMENNNLHQMIITSPSSIFYLTGKWIEPGERMLALYINTSGDSILFANELFSIQEDLGIELHIYNDVDDPVEALAKLVNNTAIGIDKQWPSHFLIRLMEKKQNVSFLNGSPIVDEVRMIKDSEEILLMKEASNLNDRAMADIVKQINAHHSEKGLSKILREIYEKYRMDSMSFSPIISYGPNCADAHHGPDESMLKKGDSIVLDIGGSPKHYSSDMTRTVFFNEPEEEFIKIYNIVLEANLKAIKNVKPGVRFCDIDKTARDIIAGEGYGKYFTHRTGHNIGIDGHEFPDVSSTNEMLLQRGMIFSIEPGIYIPGRGGVRIEDLVLVTEDGFEVLNHYTKELQII